MTTIEFYSTRGKTGCFSNFFRAPVTIGGRVWPTSEHYFQAMKFAHSPADVEAVFACPTPGDAAREGRNRNRPLRKDWEQVKDQIMLDVVTAKFLQNEALGVVLLSTGDATLVEHTTNDSYWADGGDGSGKNMLGKILMVVREKLRAAAQPGKRSRDE